MGVLYPSECPSGKPNCELGLKKLSSVALELERVRVLLGEEDLFFLQPLRVSLELLALKSSSQPDLSSMA